MRISATNQAARATGVRRRAILAAGAMGAAGAALVRTRPAAADDTRVSTKNSALFHDVRLFDGLRVREHAWVLVLDGRIAAVDSGKPHAASAAREFPVHDGRGKTLLPGLVDAHVHADDELRVDPPRFGVTTELDMFGDPGRIAAAKEQRRSLRRTRNADLWSAGIGVTVPGGHPDIPDWDYPRLTSDADPESFVAARIREGSDYVKLIVEGGGVPPVPTLPTLTAEQVRACVRAAHDRGLLVVAHAERARYARIAVEAGVDGLVHVPVDTDLDSGFVDQIRDRDVFMVPTVNVVDCGASADDLLTDRRIRPYLSETQIYLLQQRSATCVESWRPTVLRNTRRLLEAGVRVLAGTDAPLAGTANGASLLAALGYLVEAGMSPATALASATSAPAAAFGLTDRGRVVPDRRADLVLVNGDPTTDIAAVRDIAAVFKNGYAVDRATE